MIVALISLSDNSNISVFLELVSTNYIFPLVWDLPDPWYDKQFLVKQWTFGVIYFKTSGSYFSLHFRNFFFFLVWGHCLITVRVEVLVSHSASTNTGWERLECLVTVPHVIFTNNMGAGGGLIIAEQRWKSWVSVKPPLAPLQQRWVRVPLYCSVGVKVKAPHLAFANMDMSRASVSLQCLAGLE